MPYSQADKRRVFLAYRAIFIGKNAHLRRHKKVVELVNSHKPSFDPLIRDFGVSKIVEILKILLDARIFESELRAKVEFPELFRSSPVREVQRTQSENDAIRSESQALEEIESLEGRGAEEDDKLDEQPLKKISNEVGTIEPPLKARFKSTTPFRLPYVHHTNWQRPTFFISLLPRILEDSCYDFAKIWLPSLLQKHEWDCAAAVELSKWTRILTKRSGKLPLKALKLRKSSFNDVLASINRLRHTAVHRLPTAARGISQLIQSALKLVEALHDSPRAAQLKELHCEIDNKIKAIELVKNVLED